jgi:hypothetical protein
LYLVSLDFTSKIKFLNDTAENSEPQFHLQQLQLGIEAKQQFGAYWSDKVNLGPIFQ